MSAAIIVYSFILHKVTAIKILQSIASGVMGSTAYSGGTTVALLGLALHFFIAYSFAIFYFFIFPKIPFLKKNVVVSGLLYGLFAWCVMNLIVLRIVFDHPSPITLKSFIIGASILMIMIGLPVAIFTQKYYALKNKTP